MLPLTHQQEAGTPKMTHTHAPQSKKPDSDLRCILVASDLTAYSDRAFDRAVMLAEENRSALRFLHAVDPSLLPDSYVRRGLREAQALLEDEVRDSGIDKHLDVSVKITIGEADKVVVEEAQAMQADLIVMGLSHDVTLTGLVRGTTIDKVVRRARRPVLIVKSRAKRVPTRTAAAVDLAEPSRQALDFALRVFSAAQFTVVHVDEAAPDSRSATGIEPSRVERRHQIEDLVAARFVACGRDGPGSPNGPSLVFEGGRAADVLPKQLAHLHPDLVVLGTHGRTGVSSLFLGSVAETLLEVLPQDVLVARA